MTEPRKPGPQTEAGRNHLRAWAGKARTRAEFYALESDIRAIEAEAADICGGCGFPGEDCRPLWPEQRKCCPDCSHGLALPGPSSETKGLREASQKVLDEFDYWASGPRPAICGGTVRIMERALAALRAALATSAEGEDR